MGEHRTLQDDQLGGRLEAKLVGQQLPQALAGARASDWRPDLYSASIR